MFLYQYTLNKEAIQSKHSGPVEHSENLSRKALSYGEGLVQGMNKPSNGRVEEQAGGEEQTRNQKHGAHAHIWARRREVETKRLQSAEVPRHT